MNNGHSAALLKSNSNSNNRTPSLLSSYQSMLDSETESTRTPPSPEGGELLLSSTPPASSSTTIASTNNYNDEHATNIFSFARFWKLLSCCHLPPSFNYPTPQQQPNNNNNNTNGNSGNTRPFYLFPIFIAFNIFTMTDRAIIPGANVQFVNFIQHAHDSPEFAKDNPDAGIGLVNASFVFGYTIALLLSGHYVHKVRWKPLVFSGMCVWWLGVLGSGNSKQYNSFYILVFSRMATGCSEAAFQVVVPPLIQDRGGDQAGLWLSIYLLGQPVGLAFGYVYGSAVASSIGWDWAYYFICMASIPLILVFMMVNDETNGGILGGCSTDNHNGIIVVTNSNVDDDDGLEGNNYQPLLAAGSATAESNSIETIVQQQHRKDFTLFSEVKACLSSPVLVSLSLGWAAIIGVVASLGTFGGAYAMALDLFNDQRVAATWFGIAAASAGVVGTPLGGRLADRVLKRYGGHDGDSHDGSIRHAINASMLSRVNVLVALALVSIFPTLLMTEAVFFLSFLFIGWTLLFMTNTSISLVAMLSVDRVHRPNACAFLMLTSHLFGDVPIPIILGYIKDKLAPACIFSTNGEFADKEECKEQQIGVRQSLAIAYSWVIWSLIFFEVARRFAKREMEMIRRRDEIVLYNNAINDVVNDDEQESSRVEDANSLQHYHNRFRPPHYSEGEMSNHSQSVVLP